MNKVLLTGASGFLGNSLLRCLVRENQVVTSLGSRSSNAIICDLSTTVPDIKESFDLIVHAAGKAHSVPKTQAEEQNFFDVNYNGTKNLCISLETLPVKPKALIFISTVSVYGLDEGVQIDEQAPLLGSSSYARSKIMAEDYLLRWGKKNNIVIGILRLPLIAGCNPPGNLGLMINGIKNNRYVSISKADARKSIVWVDDIAGVFFKVAEVGGIYNLTDGYHPTFSDLEFVISRKFSKRKPFKIPLYVAKALAHVGDIVGDKFPLNTGKLMKITSTLTFDDRKAQELLGWNPSSVINKLNESL